jgi:hypothetical protein
MKLVKMLTNIYNKDLAEMVYEEISLRRLEKVKKNLHLLSLETSLNRWSPNNQI